MSLILNSTQIPNVIFDEWMSKLDPGEFKVIMAIARKTYGWHKVYDAISIKQLEKMTGLSRRGIQKIIRKMENKKFISCVQIKHESGDNEPNRYEINMNYPDWEIAQNLTGMVINSGHSPSALSSPPPANSVRPQKKDITKENNLPKGKYCPDQKKLTGPTKKEISFCFEKREFQAIEEADKLKWKKAYPNISLEQELAKASEWMLSNLSKARAKKKIRSFINNWLSKAENDALGRKIRQSSYSSSPPSAAPPSPQVQENIDLVKSVFEEFPKAIERFKKYGRSSISRIKDGADVSFDINPIEFKRIFYKLAGIVDV